MENLEHDVYQQFELRAECVLLEMCLGSRSHGSVTFTLLGDPLGIVQE